MTSPRAEALLEILRGRRSVRRYKLDAVPRAELEAILEAAVLAPSASNKQPWRFLVVETRATIDALARAVRSATEEALTRAPESSKDALRAYGDYFTRFEEAPTVIVPICRALHVLSTLIRSDSADALDDAAVRMESQSGVIGASLALGNMLLMAHALGLGASAMTGPLIAEPRLREILEVPTGWTILAFMPVGIPDEERPPTDRKPAERVTRWL